MMINEKTIFHKIVYVKKIPSEHFVGNFQITINKKGVPVVCGNSLPKNLPLDEVLFLVEDMSFNENIVCHEIFVRSGEKRVPLHGKFSIITSKGLLKGLEFVFDKKRNKLFPKSLVLISKDEIK